MGMYTELHFNTELKPDVPAEILEILQHMANDAPKPESVPDHPFFECERWSFMCLCDSYYFDADTHSTLRHDYQGGWFLCIRCNVKNYDSEIEKFIDWIGPYLNKDKGDFLGFYRYEETETPTLIYHEA
jgi:hypothetical protein